MELHLCSEAVDAQLFPGVNVRKSMTKNEGSLYSNGEYAQIMKLREALKGVSSEGDSLSELRTLLDEVKNTDDNAELIDKLGARDKK